MANIFMMNKEIARGMVCFFHQKKHFYFISMYLLSNVSFSRLIYILKQCLTKNDKIRMKRDIWQCCKQIRIPFCRGLLCRKIQQIYEY
jgi:hypothetical protein